jgi:5-formyltetrahydrofolate cyclo-ligase
MAWRKAERLRLLDLRLQMTAAERRRCSAAIAHHLDDALGALDGRVVGVYWPIRGEPGLREWMGRVDARGGRCALPEVIERGRPLVFRAWRPGAAMKRGVWDIPVPADGAEIEPDIVIAPVVGFDRAGYRLGYGGGFYDRTLAALGHRPLAVGVGYAMSALDTMYPLAHDIPMRFIVTEDGRVGAPAVAGDGGVTR